MHMLNLYDCAQCCIWVQEDSQSLRLHLRNHRNHRNHRIFESMASSATIASSNIASPALLEQCKELIDLVDKAANLKEDNRIVPLIRQITAAGRAAGVCFQRRFQPHEVIAHRQNRDGTVASSVRMHTVLGDICKTGADLALLAGAACMQEPVDKRNFIAYSEKQAMDPKLPKYKADEVVAAALGCTHANLAFNAIQQGLAQIKTS